METFISLAVLAFFAYGAYKLWYVPRETAKKAGGSKPDDHAKADKK
jgi:hypothetical protein